MNTIVKSSSGISLVRAESRLLNGRKVFIRREINSEAAYDFITSIMLLVKDDPEKLIDIYIINSPGGEVNAGLLIYDTIKGLDTAVNMHCVGMAAAIMAGEQKWIRSYLEKTVFITLIAVKPDLIMVLFWPKRKGNWS